MVKIYMLDWIEKDGILYSYVSVIIFMVYSFLLFGVLCYFFVIKRVINGIKLLMIKCNGIFYLENFILIVWDIVLISYVF